MWKGTLIVGENGLYEPGKLLPWTGKPFTDPHLVASAWPRLRMCRPLSPLTALHVCVEGKMQDPSALSCSLRTSLLPL